MCNCENCQLCDKHRYYTESIVLAIQENILVHQQYHKLVVES